QGNVSKENEFLMIIKSVSEQLDALIKRVKQLHSYQVPEIIALPIIGGSEDYLSWMQDQTTPHTES
ncbi:MAG TPA: divalent-cation tolerance protein CutA, partial [bacterium]